MKIPNKTNQRLSIYLGAFAALKETGVTAINSNDLEKEIGIPPTTIRRDLMLLGSNGTQRVGYNTKKMITVLENYLMQESVHIGGVYIVYRRDMCTGEESVFAIFNNHLSASITAKNMNHDDAFLYEYKYEEHELNKIVIKGED